MANASIAKQEKPKNSKTTTPLEVVTLRNNFYRDGYRGLLIICLLLIVVIAILAYWIVFERTHQPTPKYFATTYDGKIIQMPPLSEAFLSDNALKQWAIDATVQAYTFNFVNYRKALQDSRILFTKRGHQRFLQALKESRNLEAVREKKLNVSANPTGAAVIINKGLRESDNNYVWIVRFPMRVVFQSSTEQFSEDYQITLRIRRVSTLESIQGVGIESLVAQIIR